MEYAKIKTDGTCENMPNPYRVVKANPDEETKKILADMDGWLEKVYTDQPEYDPETQYLTETWVEQDGKAVQVWEVHDIPTPDESGEEA